MAIEEIVFLQFSENATNLARLATQMGMTVTFNRTDVTKKDELQKEIAFDVPSPELEQFVDSPIHADVQLVINGQSFFAHKKTLAASSKYFEAMFDQESGFKESSEFTVEVQLPVELSVNETIALLKLLYSGSESVLSNLVNGNILKSPYLVRFALIAEYLQIEYVLATFLGKMIKVGPSHFKDFTKLHFGLFEQILEMTLSDSRDRHYCAKPILDWLFLAKSLFSDQAAKLNAFKNKVIPILKEMPLTVITKVFHGFPVEFATWVDSEVFVRAVLNYSGSSCTKRTCLMRDKFQYGSFCTACGSFTVL